MKISFSLTLSFIILLIIFDESLPLFFPSIFFFPVSVSLLLFLFSSFPLQFDIYIKQTLSAISGRRPTDQMMDAVRKLSNDPNNAVVSNFMLCYAILCYAMLMNKYYIYAADLDLTSHQKKKQF